MEFSAPAVDENSEGASFNSERDFVRVAKYPAEGLRNEKHAHHHDSGRRPGFLALCVAGRCTGASSGRPPIEQPLVSEGQFAVKLANAWG